jgi:hypothetical protein
LGLFFAKMDLHEPIPNDRFYPEPGQPAPFSPKRWGIMRKVMIEFDANQKTLNGNHHILERKLNELMAGLPRLLQDLEGRLHGFYQEQPARPEFPQLMGPVQTPRVEKPAFPPSDTWRRSARPDPVEVSQIEERIVPVSVQISDFAVRQARIQLADGEEGLRQGIQEVYGYCRMIKEEMRDFHARVGLLTNLYHPLTISGRPLPNCAIPNPDVIPEPLAYIQTKSQEGGGAWNEAYNRFIAELIIETDDFDMRRFRPKPILIPHVGALERMLLKLHETVSQFPDTHREPAGYITAYILQFTTQHIRSITNLWQKIGWRAALGRVEEGVQIPYTLFELFVDC